MKATTTKLAVQSHRILTRPKSALIDKARARSKNRSNFLKDQKKKQMKQEEVLERKPPSLMDIRKFPLKPIDILKLNRAVITSEKGRHYH